LETKGLALASAGGLTAIDVTYVAKRRIAPVYLLDAVAELALIALVGIFSRKKNYETLHPQGPGNLFSLPQGVQGADPKPASNTADIPSYCQ
jgi:hypothetical protein